MSRMSMARTGSRTNPASLANFSRAVARAISSTSPLVERSIERSSLKALIHASWVHLDSDYNHQTVRRLAAVDVSKDRHGNVDRDCEADVLCCQSGGRVDAD